MKICGYVPENKQDAPRKYTKISEAELRDVAVDLGDLDLDGGQPEIRENGRNKERQVHSFNVEFISINTDFPYSNVNRNDRISKVELLSEICKDFDTNGICLRKKQENTNKNILNEKSTKVDNLMEIKDLAEEKGINIALENGFFSKKKFEEILNSLNPEISTNIGITFDPVKIISKTSIDVKKALQKLGDKIKVVNLRDLPFRVESSENRIINYNEIFATLNEIDFDGPIIVDMDKASRKLGMNPKEITNYLSNSAKIGFRG